MTARIVTLPTLISAPWVFWWPSKAPSENSEYAIDASAWLAREGTTLNTTTGAMTIEPSRGIYILEYGANNGVITVQLSGGIPSTTAVVDFNVPLTNGDIINIPVFLPIRYSPYKATPLPNNALVLNGVPMMLTSNTNMTVGP